MRALRIASAVTAVLLLEQSHPALAVDSRSCLEGSAVEVTVCDDDDLWTADQSLSELAGKIRPSEPTIDDDQQRWKSTVRDSCLETSCLARVYSSRYAELRGRVTRIQERQAQAALQVAPANIAPDTPTVSNTFQTSFDCAADGPRARRIICAEETLAAADLESTRLVSMVLTTHPDQRVAHETWARDVRDVCLDERCLARAYATRIGELKRIAAEEASPDRASTIVSNEDGTRDSSYQSEEGGGAVQTARSQFNSIIEAHSGPEGSLLLWSPVIFFVIVLVLGSSKQVVICYDGADFFWCMAPILASALGFYLFKQAGSADLENVTSPDQQAIVVVTSAFVTHSFLKIFANAVKYNRSIGVGLVVGLFKVMLGLVSIILLLGALNKATDRNRSRVRPNTLALVLLFGFVVWAYRAVMNGKDVYEERNWNLVNA